MVQILITFLVALIGAAVAVKLKVPAGAMIGALISVAVFNIAFDYAYFPPNFKVMVQMISGLFIGCKITRQEVQGLKYVVKPAIINTLLLVICCIGMGVIMHLTTGYSLATSIFATAPGSMVDMSIISMDMGADPAVVSVLQLVRLLSILCLFPTLFKTIINRVHKKVPQTVPCSDTAEAEAGAASYEKTPVVDPAAHTFPNILLTLAVAVVSGSLGYIIGIPAGTLIFAMTGVTIQNVTTGTSYMPGRIKQFAQVCAGSLIGASVSRSSVMSMRNVIVPAFLMIAGLIVIVLFLALILYRTSNLDFVTALFSCAPGGASDLALIAEEFGANTPKVSIVQYMRVICVIIIYPPVIHLLTPFLS